MRRLTLLCSAFLLVACARASDDAPDTAAVGGTVGTAALTAADVQGRWNVRGTRENSDSVIVSYEMNFTGDPTTWTVNLPNRDPIPLTVSFEGDSVVTQTGSFESVLRPGVQATSRSVSRMRDGQLVGATTVRYSGGGADSVLVIRTTGTRAN